MVLWLLAISNVAVTLALVVRMQRFAVAHPAIDSVDRLRAYQQFVSVQMWGVLFNMGVTLVLPVTIVGQALTMGRHASPSWGPIMLLVVPMFLRKQIRAAEERCRSLPTTPALEAAYDAISKVWVGKALPRFADLPLPEAASTSAARIACQTHGEGAPAGTCTRCGAYRCLECDRKRQSPAALCEECSVHFREVREQGLPSERASRTAAYMVVAIGVVEVSFGAMMAMDEQFPPVLRAAAVLVFALGLLGSVGGTLWSWFGDLGRRLALLASVPHLLVFPMGTAVAVFGLVTATRNAHVTSERYVEAMRMTKTDDFVHVVVAAIIAIVVVPLYVGNLTGLGMAFLGFAVR